MKYYVIQSSNGTVSVVSEWSDLNSAIVAYHDRCKILWNAQEVVAGVVMLVDSSLNTVGGYREFITHEQEETTEEDI
jgi:hypothetical protein